MPIIDGIKMACEPCIRGHRSTKCTHEGERVMVPVRKPGRPLSTCPGHPTGNRCGCGSGRVTAAIPKKVKCGGCASRKTSAVKTEPTGDVPVPLSPAKSTSRIQKSGTKRSSYDPIGLGRLDNDSLNAMSSYHVMPGSTPSGMGNIDFGPSSHVPPYIHGYEQAPPPIFQNSAPFHMPVLPNGLDQPRPSVDSRFSSQADGLLDRSPTVSTNGTRTSSCCSGISAASGSSSTMQYTPTSSSGSTTHDQVPPLKMEGSSCCAPKTQTPEAQQFDAYNPSRNASNMMQQQLPLNFNGPVYANYQGATIFAYPANLGTYAHPLQPWDWERAMATMNTQPQPAYPPQQNMSLDSNTDVSTYSTSTNYHECDCGPGCNCLGCSAHPYNEATRESIRRAMEFQARQNSTAMSSSYDPIISGRSDAQSPVDDPSPAHTPSDTTSTLSGDEHIVSSDNKFLFVSYPNDDFGCNADAAECPCGDDCGCLGCMIHGNPLPLVEEVLS